MKSSPLVLICALVLGLPQPLWADGGEPTVSDQVLLDCNARAKAKNLNGEARKTFMHECTSGPQPPAVSVEPAETGSMRKMKSCNASAKQKDLKGDARQAYMTACLGGAQL